MTTLYDTHFVNNITGLFGEPFYTGTSASSAEVPDKFSIALDGRAFMLEGAPLWRTIATLRTQNDDREAGELSLNPEGLWRRSNSSWELGAGQVMYDDESADRQRFRASKGVEVWTPGQATLLPDTVLQASATGNYLQVESTANHVYWANQNTVVRSDLTTEANVTGTPGTPITSMASAGSYMLVGYTNNGVYKIEGGTTVGAPWMTDAVTPSVIGWAKGRVIVCVGNAVFNPITAFTASDTLTDSHLFTHPDATFEWVGIAEGTSWIYIGGTLGDKSAIYRTVVRSDGTELDIPTIAGRLLNGEMLTSMHGYLGILILGTSRGFRVAQANGNGDLVIGKLVDIGAAVLAMEGQGEFVYFSWSNYDSVSTGVGRMDLSNLTDVDNLVPAYASDLMATTQGEVAGIAYLDDTVVFGVNGVGVYKTHPTELVDSGIIETGIIRYGITEEKVVVGARAAWTGSGTVTLEASRDTGPFAPIGQSGAQQRGINFEMRATIEQDGSHVSPRFESMTLFSYPAPEGTMFIDLPVIIAEQIQTVAGIEVYQNVAETLAFLRDRFRSKVLVALQLGSETFQVTLEAFRFEANNEGEEQRGIWNGTATLSLKVIT